MRSEVKTMEWGCSGFHYGGESLPVFILAAVSNFTLDEEAVLQGTHDPSDRHWPAMDFTRFSTHFQGNGFPHSCLQAGSHRFRIV